MVWDPGSRSEQSRAQTIFVIYSIKTSDFSLNFIYVQQNIFCKFVEAQNRAKVFSWDKKFGLKNSEYKENNVI